MDYVGDIVGWLDIKNGAGSGALIWGNWREDEPPAPASPHILEWVSKRDPPPLVVVDCLIAFFNGGNENDCADDKKSR